MAVYDWGSFGLHIPRIMVPAEGTDYSRWAVIACDQFTSEPQYWEDVDRIVGDAPSTLRLMLPEVYLDKPDELERISAIRTAMDDYLTDGTLTELEPGCMLVRRQVDGKERLGLVIATDLECYDYHKDSRSLIRATEGTVVERIPPRLRIRANAPLEMPHIIILIDDPDKSVIEPLTSVPQTPVYDTDLMKDGGHVSGSFIREADLEGMRESLSALYEKAVATYGPDDVILQAMGDGNHSLATAKANWENIKATLTPEEAAVHPARYALCELENIHDSGIIFEPIHRVVFGRKGQSGQKLVDEVVKLLDQQNGKAYIANPDTAVPENAFVIPYMTAAGQGSVIIEQPANKLEVGALQNALDVMVNHQKDADIDYIHGSATLASLASEEGCAGFALPAMDKSRLFPAVAADGALPRKTFSMGEAIEKRYYIECRHIAS